MSTHTDPPARSHTDALDHTGRTILVTGGTRGIGRVIAERYLAAGADVVVCGRKDPEQLPTVDGVPASFVSADVRDDESVASLVESVVGLTGRLDVLINNAGGSPYCLAADASPRFTMSILNLNLVAPLLCATAANAVMQGQDSGGSVINIASVSGTRPSPGTAAYGAAKAGVLSLTETLAVEWAPKVRVNAVTAGMIRTELAHLHYGDEEGIAAVGRTVPMGTMGDPDDVASTCLFLSSPLAKYVSGANLLVHGGGEQPRFLDAANP